MKHKFKLLFSMETKTEMTPEQKDITKKVINFVIEVLKLIVAGFLGATGSNVLF